MVRNERPSITFIALALLLRLKLTHNTVAGNIRETVVFGWITPGHQKGETKAWMGWESQRASNKQTEIIGEIMTVEIDYVSKLVLFHPISSCVYGSRAFNDEL